MNLPKYHKYRSGLNDLKQAFLKEKDPDKVRVMKNLHARSRAALEKKIKEGR